MAHKKRGREAVLWRSLPLYVSRAIVVAVIPVIAIIGVERDGPSDAKLLLDLFTEGRSRRR